MIQLETPRLLLRPFVPEDLAALRQELLETKAQLTQVQAEKEDILRRLRKLVEEYGE